MPKNCHNQANPPSKSFHWEVDNNSEIAWKKQMILVHLMHDEIRFFCLMPECLTNLLLSAHKILLHYSVNDKFPLTYIEEDEDVQARLKIKTSISDVNRHNDAGHIDFICPTQTSQVQTAYSLLLDSELTSRKMYCYCVHLVEVKQRYLQLSI